MTSRPGASISFDRAAAYYDKTRAMSPEAATKVRDLLLSELRDGDPVLEVGVGTGRIALPLHSAGVAMVGIDLSHSMLARLVSNAGGAIPFPLLRGDATMAPFPDSTFGAAIASWVLHLIPPWRKVVAEMTRVVAPGGVLLVDAGNLGLDLTTEITLHFRDAAGVTDWPPGARGHDQVDQAMEALGAARRELEPVVEVVESALETHISLLEQGVYSVTFGLTEGQRKTAAETTRAWARERFGDLGETRSIELRHVWRAYDLP